VRKLLSTCGIVLALGLASSAHAQATRTWVSGVGDDVNPCSRTAPCKTFAGAISKTADKGEISVLDPGGYGAVTITKSITIDGAGTLASFLYSGTNGVNVNDSATATPNTIEVNLRNLTINGGNTGLDGVRFVSGKRLSIENVQIFNATGDGIDVVTTAAAAQLHVRNTTIEHMRTGMRVTPVGSGMIVNIVNTNVSRSRTSDNIILTGANMVGILHNVTTTSAAGVNASGILISNSATIALDHVTSTGNVFGLQTALNGGLGPNVRLKDCVMVGNSSDGVQNNGGNITAFQSNDIVGTGGVVGSTPPM
jgi:hypothetical protein